jgi:hypothetical protein
MVSTMKRIAAPLIAVTLSLLSPVHAFGAEQWWTYVASYGGMPGAIRVDLALNKSAPVAGYPNLITTGSTYKSPHADQMPEGREQDRLDALSLQVIATVQKTTPSIYVGSFTAKHKQTHYFYVKDPSKVEKALAPVYAHICSVCTSSTSSKPDAAWSVYFDSLYPNAKTRTFYRKDLTKLGVSVE